MLDEGIDVPDAEVGINVAGTKTKLQLVQRMGRVLRKHGDQRPHFHHFIAMPDENYLAGLDSKGVRTGAQLGAGTGGETIGVQPIIEEAGVDAELLERAEQRGHELWARDLLEDLEVETVQGNVNLEQLLDELTVEATEILLDELWLEGERVAQDDWEAAMEALRDSEALSVEGLQRVWWLFPLYRERPTELDELLTASLSALSEGSLFDTTVTTRDGHQPRGTSSDGESADEARLERAIHTSRSRHRRRRKTTNPVKRQPRRKTLIHQSPQFRIDRRRVTSAGAWIVEDAGTDVQVRSSSVFDVLGVGEPPHSHFETAASRSRHRSIPRRDPPDEHGQWRPLLDRLSAPAIAPNVPAEWEGVIFLLASKRQTPEYTGQQLPELNGYRAITAITPTRALCVVGNDPANQTIQIRHEDVTSVDVQQAGQLLWKHHAIRIQTNDQTLKIPDGTDTDLEAAARYIRTAAYEERCAAGERLLECCDVVATSNGFTTVDAVLDAAKTRFQSAVDWGERYDLDTARAEAGVEFTNTCLERADRQVRFEESLTEAQRLVSDARTASINGEEDRAQQQYREAKSKLEAVLSASDEKPSSSVVESQTAPCETWRRLLRREPIAVRGRRNRVLRPRQRPLSSLRK